MNDLLRPSSPPNIFSNIPVLASILSINAKLPMDKVTFLCIIPKGIRNLLHSFVAKSGRYTVIL